MAGIPEPLAKLKAAVEDAGFSTTIDEPTDALHGEWWLDIFDGGDTPVEEIVYSNGNGFGFFEQVMSAGFGERPTDLVATPEQAMEIVRARLQ